MQDHIAIAARAAPLAERCRRLHVSQSPRYDIRVDDSCHEGAGSCHTVWSVRSIDLSVCSAQQHGTPWSPMTGEVVVGDVDVGRQVGQRDGGVVGGG